MWPWSGSAWRKKKSLKHLLTPAQMRVALRHELNFKQVPRGCPGMVSQIRLGQTSPEQRPFPLLIAGATIMVINISPACHSTVKLYDQKKYVRPFALLGSSPACPCSDRSSVRGFPARCLPCPTCWAVIQCRERCFSSKKQKEDTKKMKPNHRSRAHTAPRPGFPARVGVLGRRAPRSCRRH